MNKLDSFLKTLSDVELAKFIVYRYKDFVGTSKGTIISEAKTRNLNHLDIKRLYNQDVNYDDKIKNRCEQCGSARFYTETDYEMRQTNTYLSYEVAIESERCRICGFNPDKNSKGLLNSIKKKLGLFHKTRLKRPEIDGNLFT
jgi:ribosomal protein S14